MPTHSATSRWSGPTAQTITTLGLWLGILALAFSNAHAEGPAEGPAMTGVAAPTPATSTPRLSGEIVRLIKTDFAPPSGASTSPAPATETSPVFAMPATVSRGEPVSDDVLVLDPFRITTKKPVELRPVRPRITLENFFYGDGKIAESADGRFSLSAGPERRGLAALKLNIKW